MTDYRPRMERFDGDGTSDSPRILQAIVEPLADATKALEQIESIVDHKGVLCVEWRSVPRRIDVKLVVLLWAEALEYQTEHRLLGARIFDPEALIAQSNGPKIEWRAELEKAAPTFGEKQHLSP